MESSAEAYGLLLRVHAPVIIGTRINQSKNTLRLTLKAFTELVEHVETSCGALLGLRYLQQLPLKIYHSHPYIPRGPNSLTLPYLSS